jgi:uncharacterized paraquat-inducible protein A
VAACPRCDKKLSFGQIGIGTSFDCPCCKIALKSNGRKLLWPIVLFAIAGEVALYLLFYKSTGDGTLTLVLFLAIGGLAAFMIYWLFGHVLTEMGVIRVSSDTDSGVPRAI